jgi:hypothetical protein
MPAAFARDIIGDGKDLYVGSKHHDGKTISQSGVFDYFLCEEHELMIHDYEDVAIKFCRAFEVTPSEIAQRAFIRSETDNESLIRFVCSVLWRYAVSKRI